jgi:hypothetical protein
MARLVRPVAGPLWRRAGAHPAQAARYDDLKHRPAGLLETERPAYSGGKAQMIAEFLRQARLPVQY